jgi:hypothetical protein
MDLKIKFVICYNVLNLTPLFFLTATILLTHTLITQEVLKGGKRNPLK